MAKTAPIDYLDRPPVERIRAPGREASPRRPTPKPPAHRKIAPHVPVIDKILQYQDPVVTGHDIAHHPGKRAPAIDASAPREPGSR
jgi:hypothetical protein